MAEGRTEPNAANMGGRSSPPPPHAPAEQAGCSPLAAAFALGEYVRLERGTAGVRQYIAALNALIPYDMIEQLTGKFDVCAPPKPPEPCAPPAPEKPEKPAGLSTEQLLLMMNALGGGQKGGLDPSLLMKLMKN